MNIGRTLRLHITPLLLCFAITHIFALSSDNAPTAFGNKFSNIPFPEGSSQLPAGPVDVKALINAMESARFGQKSEFEKTEEYDQRVMKFKFAGAISTESHVFLARPIKDDPACRLTYSADAEEFAFNCIFNDRFGEFKDHRLRLKIEENYQDAGAYIAANAFNRM